MRGIHAPPAAPLDLLLDHEPTDLLASGEFEGVVERPGGTQIRPFRWRGLHRSLYTIVSVNRGGSALLVWETGPAKTLALDPDSSPLTLGRGAGCDLVLDDP